MPSPVLIRFVLVSTPSLDMLAAPWRWQSVVTLMAPLATTW